jgi:hypothetical protein
MTPYLPGKNESDLCLFFLNETCPDCLKSLHYKCRGSFCRVDHQASAAYHVLCDCKCHVPKP